MWIRFAMMARLHPELVYGNQDFYAALSDWFVRAVWSNPFEVIRIYLTKFLYILVHSGNFIIMLVSSLFFWLGYRRFRAEYPAKLRHAYGTLWRCDSCYAVNGHSSRRSGFHLRSLSLSDLHLLPDVVFDRFWKNLANRFQKESKKLILGYTNNGCDMNFISYNHKDLT